MQLLLNWCAIEPDFRRFTVSYEGFYNALEPLYRVKTWSVHRGAVNENGDYIDGPVRDWSPREGTGSSIEAAIADAFREPVQRDD